MHTKPTFPIIIEHPIVHGASGAMEPPMKIPRDVVAAVAQDLHDKLGPNMQVVVRATRHGHWRFQIEKLDGDHVTLASKQEDEPR